MSTRKFALVTGANRGLGLATVEALAQMGMEVILGSRDGKKGEEQAARLMEKGLSVIPLKLDVESEADVRAARDFVEKKWGRLDILINNAGVLLDGPVDQDSPGPLSTSTSVLEETLNANVVGAYRMTRAFLPLMLKQKHGRIVNISSGMGGLTEMKSGWPAYRISKTALNSLTRVLSRDLAGTDILVNAVCPGWVRTDMGTASAVRSLEEGVAGILWAATLPEGGPTGGYFRDGKALPW